VEKQPESATKDMWRSQTQFDYKQIGQEKAKNSQLKTYLQKTNLHMGSWREGNEARFRSTQGFGNSGGNHKPLAQADHLGFAKRGDYGTSNKTFYGWI